MHLKTERKEHTVYTLAHTQHLTNHTVSSETLQFPASSDKNALTGWKFHRSYASKAEKENSTTVQSRLYLPTLKIVVIIEGLDF